MMVSKDDLRRTNNHVARLLTLLIQQHELIIESRRPSTHSTKGEADFEAKADAWLEKMREALAHMQGDPLVPK